LPDLVDFHSPREAIRAALDDANVFRRFHRHIGRGETHLRRGERPLFLTDTRERGFRRGRAIDEREIQL
jgi:hypothetical protein